MIDHRNIWTEVLERLEQRINRHSWETWLRPTQFAGDDGYTITVNVPNRLFIDWLLKHYSGAIADSLADAGRPLAGVRFLAPVREESEPDPRSTRPRPLMFDDLLKHLENLAVMAEGDGFDNFAGLVRAVAKVTVLQDTIYSMRRAELSPPSPYGYR